MDNVADIIRRAWEANRHELQYQKNWLEEECIAWLKRFLEYGKDALQRTGKEEASDCSQWNNLEPEQCGQGGYTRRERGDCCYH